MRSAEPTYTIPVVSINTENGVPVVDKETKIPATMNLTVPEGYVTLNNKEAKSLSDVALTIRGRGNASWQLDKKPYKLKFESKTEVLGMPKNKHFSLIAYAGNYSGSVAGMELARCTGQSWAPHSEPVEVVLNGEYIGRYFLVENIKIDKNRLNIAEQPDMNEDPATLEGGWLVEIDNTSGDPQIVIPEVDNVKLRVTYKTPEVLSDLQELWLTNQFLAMNSAIYSGDKTGSEWAELIEPASVARYFIVRETLGDTDGYNGSFYLHRDFGDDKWTFGPMWDLVLDRKKDWVFNDHPAYSAVHWIEPMFNTDVFQKALIEQWELFKPQINKVYDYMDRLGELCLQADVANYERWPQYEKGDSKGEAGRAKRILSDNFAWIDKYVAAAGMGDISVADDFEPIRIVGNICRVAYGENAVSIALFRADGRKVAERTCTGGDAIDLAAYGKGAFIVRATAPSSRTTTKKVVVM